MVDQNRKSTRIGGGISIYDDTIDSDPEYKEALEKQGISFSNSGKSMDFNWEFPARPDLDPYTGDTNVSLWKEQRRMIDLTDQMVQGNVGNLRKYLEGEPDFGMLDRAVIQPMRRQTEEDVLQLRDLFSSGPYGSGYDTGAAKAATAQRLRQDADTVAMLRYQEGQRAEQREFQAISALPSLFSIQDVARQNEIANIEREMRVHYSNQGLEMQEFQAGLGIANLQNSAAQFEAGYAQRERAMQLQQEMFEEQQRAQSRSAFSGLLGTAAGVGLSAFLPGVGPLVAGQIGGGIGQAFGGNYAGGAQNIMGGFGQQYAMNQQQTLMGMLQQRTVDPEVTAMYNMIGGR